jgi:N6-adenosine-specific RNA methylase IME4
MSESATIINCFFVPWLLKTAAADTLQAAGAEDKSLLGSKLSADSGAKTRLGLGEELSPSGELDSLGLASAR